MSYPVNIINKAKILRQQGFSLSEIASNLKVSKSTASLWTSKVKLTEIGLKRARNRQNIAREKGLLTIQKKRINVRKEIEIQSQLTLDEIKLTTPLTKLLTSIFLWTEGEKGNFDRLGFTNSDPVMISTFLFLLRNSFSLDETKFRALVHIHEYHKNRKVIKFWSELTNIPLSQFTKSYLKPHTGKRIRKNYMGSIHINYYDYKVARELASVYNMFANKFLGL